MIVNVIDGQTVMPTDQGIIVLGDPDCLVAHIIRRFAERTFVAVGQRGMDNVEMCIQTPSELKKRSPIKFHVHNPHTRCSVCNEEAKPTLVITWTRLQRILTSG
jgi:hypothetical protein